MTVRVYSLTFTGGTASMKRIVVPLLFALLISRVFSAGASANGKTQAAGQRAAAADQAFIEEIKKLESDRLAAGVRKDIEAVSAATADDYIQIDIDGKVLDRAATLQRIKSSYAQLSSNAVDEMVVRIYGNTAVLTARAKSKGILNGKEFGGALRYTRVYVKRGGRWQVVLFQQTRVTDDK
jgi:ketosteroid isomerase-like protein